MRPKLTRYFDMSVDFKPSMKCPLLNIFVFNTDIIIFLQPPFI